MPAKIVVALLNEEQEFQQLQAKTRAKSARRLGLELEVHFAQGHAVVQIQQLFKHIHATPSGAPARARRRAGGRRRPRARRAQRGEGGRRLDPDQHALRLPRRLRQEHQELPIGMVGSDQKEVRPDPGPAGRAARGQAGRVLCVQGPADSAATMSASRGSRRRSARAASSARSTATGPRPAPSAPSPRGSASRRPSRSGPTSSRARTTRWRSARRRRSSSSTRTGAASRSSAATACRRAARSS